MPSAPTDEEVKKALEKDKDYQASKDRLQVIFDDRSITLAKENLVIAGVNNHYHELSEEQQEHLLSTLNGWIDRQRRELSKKAKRAK